MKRRPALALLSIKGAASWQDLSLFGLLDCESKVPEKHQSIFFARYTGSSVFRVIGLSKMKNVFFNLPYNYVMKEEYFKRWVHKTETRQPN